MKKWEFTRNKKDKLYNADLNVILDIDSIHGFAVSFLCLKQLGLKVGECDLIDYTVNTCIAVKASELKPKLNKSLINAGYTTYSNNPVNNKISFAGNLFNENNTSTLSLIVLRRDDNCDVLFHKAGSALLKAGKKFYLLGFDDSQYFGCELPAQSRPKTLDEAHEALKPLEIRSNPESVLGRQGEWFMMQISLEPSKIPITERYSNVNFALPKDDQKSNNHEVCCEWFTILEDGTIAYCHASLLHWQHPTLNSPKNKLVQFLRNTAVRSVSTEGVD